MHPPRMSAAEFRALPKGKAARPLKYRNKPVTVDGVRFDSQKEHRRWEELKLLERAGEIRELERQAVFRLVVNGVTVGRYIADAAYLDRDGKQVVEDVKSPITRENPVYRIKRQLMWACYGIAIVEV